MNSFKTSNKNLDATYVYKVEEIEEDEKISHTSAYGEISTSGRTYPKVTRYFIRNDKGESQGYFERKFNPKSETDNSCEKSTNPTSAKQNFDPFVFCKEDIQPAFKYGQRSGNDDYKFDYRDRHLKCDPITKLNEIMCNNKSIYTLDYTSSNSTPSEKNYGIKHLTSSTDPMTVIGPKRKRKIGVKAKKSASLFCKDPNDRLTVRPFTIIKSKEKSTENLSDNTVSNCQHHSDLISLNEAKQLLVNLIDKELQRIQLNTNSNANDNIQQKQMEMKTLNNCVLKALRLECMRKIEDELRLLKRLGNN